MENVDLEEPLLVEAAEEEEVPSTTTSSSSCLAPFILLLVAFLFATLNVSLRSLYTEGNAATPGEVNAVRGWFTVLCFLPLVVLRRRKTTPRVELSATTTSPPPPRSLIFAALELALWNFGGQAFVNMGLVTTPSARASFLGQTILVIVPLLSALGGEKLTWKNGAGCLCSIVGVLLLSSTPTTTSSSSLHLLPGDLWILCSAFCFSCYLIRITHLATHYDEVYLQGTKNTIMAVFYTIWGTVSRHSSLVWTHSVTTWMILAYTAFGPGVMADILQQRAQKVVGATQSNLILCTSSVFTAILARLTLGEQTSVEEKWGGFFLLTGAMIAGSSFKNA